MNHDEQEDETLNEAITFGALMFLLTILGAVGLYKLLTGF